jgi:predicted dehydrogenase/nucleoside-diphosphate-sugar epimerase
MAGAHLLALRRVPTPHTLVGVCDVNVSQAQWLAARAGTEVYRDLTAMLRQATPHVVHVCTPAGTHFEPALQALQAGAHVYVEKPFVERRDEAETLFQVAREQERLLCAGHQLVRHPAFRQLLRQGSELSPAVLIDSYFAFRPPQLALHRAVPRDVAKRLLDILPHPLYSLLATVEQFAGTPPVLTAAFATPAELHALLRAGDVSARLFVSLKARPVASTLTITGAQGTLSADFVRGIVVGAGNEGTGPLEKVINPFLEGAQLIWRSAVSLGRRLLGGGGYPGLAELLGDFYRAVAAGGPPPLSVEHLRWVTAVYEALASEVWSAAERAARQARARSAPEATHGAPLSVVTGASGFLGREITRELTLRGFRVRGVGRAAQSSDPHLAEWVCADLGRGVPPSALAGAQVVVHAAAETAGGFEAHQHNTVEATRHLLGAMELAGARRLVYVSSLSVLRPPRTFWERQDERTALATRPEKLGAYTWGKCVAEALVMEAERHGRIEARILRPAALIEWDRPELPGLVGRRVFGRWHLGFGRPGHAMAVLDIRRAGAVTAWCAARFDEAPPVVNLIDDAIGTKGELLAAFRARGWCGRMVWVPISVLAGLVGAVQWLLALARFRAPKRLAVWSVLRARHYDASLAVAVLRASGHLASPVGAREPVGSPP